MFQNFDEDWSYRTTKISDSRLPYPLFSAQFYLHVQMNSKIYCNYKTIKNTNLYSTNIGHQVQSPQNSFHREYILVSPHMLLHELFLMMVLRHLFLICSKRDYLQQERFSVIHSISESLLTTLFTFCFMNL